MEIKIAGTIVFQKNWEAIHSDKRFVVNQGSSGCSKTVSLCQIFTLLALQTPNICISIIRKTGPSLIGSVIKDLFKVMRDMGVYDEKAHKVKDAYYRFPNGSIIEWFSCDSEEKLRGRKRDYAYINEATEVDYEEFQQIAMRTSKKIVVDFNPSLPDSYLYNLPEDKTFFIKSTYKDNPFLSEGAISQIESYKDTDEDLWKIFGLGERAFSKENVFNKWTECDKPDDMNDYVYGVDFGFSHPTAVTRVWYSRTRRALWLEEIIYQSHLTSTDIISKMKSGGVETNVPVICETARPEVLEDFRRAGFQVHLADKHVIPGIHNMKTFNISVSPSSKNIIKENFNYRYKQVNGRPSEEPIKLWDDAIDSVRYAAMWIKKNIVTNGAPRKARSFNF